MLDWFYGLTSPEQVFWALAIIATLIFIFILITTFAGGDKDTDMDFEIKRGTLVKLVSVNENGVLIIKPLSL